MSTTASANGTKDPYTFANDTQVPLPISTMMRKYYSNLDGPTHPNDIWLDALTEDVEFTLGVSPTLQGRQGPEMVRASISHPNGPVARMNHRAETLFVLPGGQESSGLRKGELEVMMTGGVTYTLADGRLIDCPLAIYAVVVMPGEGGDGQARMRIYQGFIDLGELRKAIEEFQAGKLGQKLEP